MVNNNMTNIKSKIESLRDQIENHNMAYHVINEPMITDKEYDDIMSELIKLEEKKKAGITAAPSVFKPLPPRLPALMFAEAVWKQINKKGLPYQGIVDKIAVDGVAKDLTDEQLGKQLFELTCAAQSRGLDPEGALRRYADRVTYAVEKKMSS